MSRAMRIGCDTIVLSLNRRSRIGLNGESMDTRLEGQHLSSLLDTVNSFTRGALIFASDNRHPTSPALRKGVRHVTLRADSSAGIRAPLEQLKKLRFRSSRVLILDASAPFIEGGTLRALLGGLRSSQAAGIFDNGCAIALRRSEFAALTAHRTDSPSNLWEWLSGAQGRGRGPLKISEIASRHWYERPLTSLLEAYKAAKDSRLNSFLELASRGLTLEDPARFDLRGSLSYGRNVRIDINVLIIGDVYLGDGVTIGSNCIIESSRILANSQIKDFSIVSGSTIGSKCQVGPYARIRPQSSIGKCCQIGNYVEIKRTTMAANCRINHHSFIGDAKLGRNVTIGAGSITCNSDGTNTSRTVIGGNAFVGSGVMMVAPLHVGARAFIGAGSTVVDNVPANCLTLARAKQISIRGWTPAKKRKHP